MQSTNWINLLSRIPAEYHESLAFILNTGSELVVQRLLRLEPDFVVLRGRMAGTQDNGRVVVVSYDQLCALAFQRRMTDPEVEAVFGGGVPPFAAAAPAAEAAAADPVAAPEESTVNGPEGDVNTSPKPSLPSKSMLLAKLRARLAEAKQGKP